MEELECVADELVERVVERAVLQDLDMAETLDDLQ